MALAAGTRLGSYEVVSSLGAGGMGEVYRARDTRLHREVALKVLPESFADDPERLARFEREAQVLAALKHPHIATIHGLEEKDGARALVLELVDGQTLAEIVGKGPMPPEEVLRVARQIADAVDAAHEHGIIHRDLKPANITLTPDGTVKVLDFGLAKLTGHAEAGPYAQPGSTLSVSMSPTMTSPALLTGATVLMGTAGYMAPEQARGKPVDKRADIWAFGVVLYEMLAGGRAFEGETVTEVAGAVIHKDPDWNALPAATPPVLRMVVRRCLQKDPKQRFRDMGDVRLALDGAFATESAVAAIGAPSAASRRRALAVTTAAAVAAAIAAGVAVWVLTRAEPAVARDVIRFDVAPVPLPDLSPLIEISPDGRLLSFVALDSTQSPRLWVRSLETGEARIVAPADVTRQPMFWSPDSRSLGFYSDGKLKRVDVAGGPPEIIVEAADYAGGSWSRDDVIVFSNVNGIMQVPARGGEAVPIMALDKPRKESAQLLPSFLSDGRHFLYLRMFGGVDSQTGIYIGSIDSKPEEQNATRLMAAGQNAVYAPSPGSGTGHVLFLRDGLLMAQPFDEGRLSTIGNAVRVGADRIEMNSVLASFSASSNGTLIYRKGSESTGTLSVVDRGGKVAPLFPDANLDRAANPRLSPDGRRLAVVLAEALWLYDLGGRPPIKLTFGEEPAYSPIWAADGRRIIYERGGDGATSLFAVAADGSGSMPEPVAPEGHFHPHGWSAGGEIVAARVANNAGDLVRFAPQPGAKIEDILATPQSEGFAASVSPDGRWLAYTADPTGRTEIWVRPVSGAGAAVRVSPNGGNEPVWSRDGRELFYIEDRKMMAVPVTTGAEFNFKPPTELFATNIVRGQQPPSYDVAPDGRFVMMTVPDTEEAPITVILNWTELLRDRAATH